MSQFPSSGQSVEVIAERFAQIVLAAIERQSSRVDGPSTVAGPGDADVPNILIGIRTTLTEINEQLGAIVQGMQDLAESSGG